MLLLSGIRRHLRLLTAIWLCSQTVALSALAPPFCCAMHGKVGDSEDTEHSGHGAHSGAGHATEHCQTSADAESCPMARATGVPCPMHQAASHHDEAVPGSAASIDSVDNAGGVHHAGPAAHPAGSNRAEPAALASDPRSATAGGGECALRGDCRVPTTALASLIWIPGILDETAATRLAGEFEAFVSKTPSTLAAADPIHLPPPRL